MNQPHQDDTANGLRMLSASPRLYIDTGFCTPDELEALRAAVFSAEDAAAVGLHPKDDETGLGYELPVDGNNALEALRARIEAVSGIANVHGETFRFRRYLPGRSHPAHLDGYTIDGYDLVATAMLCIEAPALGGDTVFPDAEPGPVRVIPRAGQLVLWFNLDEDGDDDLEALHLSAPVLDGEKVTLTAFIYADRRAAAATIEAPPVDDDTLDEAISPQPRDAGTLLRGLGRRFVCIDEDVPESTIRILRHAAWERGLRFDHLIASAFDYDPARRLEGGELMYRPATSLASMRVEQFLHHPQTGTFYTRDDSLFWDPISSSMMFERAGISIARTIYAASADRDLQERWTDFLGGFPLVVKVLGGQRGIGVMRVDSNPALYSLMDFALSQGHTPLLCSFVPNAVHWRVVVVGDKAVAWYRNADEDNDFRTYGSDDPTDYMGELPDGAEEMAVKACHLLENAFGGVDILEHPSGRLYLLEANFPCYFAQAQEVVGVDIGGAMLDYLLDRAMSAEESS